MRSDMAKVIVERPRRGGGVKYPRGSVRHCDRLPIEDWHRRESCEGAWSGNRWQKNLNENLAPLERFLRSRVGQHWDKVYSEICERINRSSAVQLHIWQHLVAFVCTNPYEIGGDVRRGWFRSFKFYVDPKTGQLREGERRWHGFRASKPPPIEYVRIAADRVCRQIDGLWYELELRPLPASPLDRGVYDVVLRRNGPFVRGDLRHLYGGAFYAVKKRQLNTREIRRLAIVKTGQN